MPVKQGVYCGKKMAAPVGHQMAGYFVGSGIANFVCGVADALPSLQEFYYQWKF